MQQASKSKLVLWLKGQWQIVTLASLLLISSGIWLALFRSSHNEISLEISNPPIPRQISLKDHSDLNLGANILDWFDQRRQALFPPFGIYSCDITLADCTTETVIHRDVIPLLYAHNWRYRRTLQSAAMETLSSNISDLDHYYQTELDPYEQLPFVFQPEYYHCVLIKNILDNNADLSATNIEALQNICTEATFEIIAASVREETAFRQLQNNLPLKINALQGNGTYDWISDPTINKYNLQELTYNDYIKNLSGAADRAAQSLVGPFEIIDHRFEPDTFLDAALTSYYQLRQAPDEDYFAAEIYHQNLKLIYVLQLFQQISPNYQLQPLIEQLLTQLEPLTQTELNDLWRTINGQIYLADLCFLESNVGKDNTLTSGIKTLLLSIKSQQEDVFPTATFQPFYDAPFGPWDGQVAYAVKNNGLIAGCLLSE